MQTIGDCKKQTILKLQSVSESPAIDADALLAHVLETTRVQLYTHPDKMMTESDIKKLDALLKRRLAGEPIAYLTGHKAFWTMDLFVTQDTLIPRPETECVVQWILDKYPKKTPLQVADLGTGSGAIAIALALERPTWIIHATDKSQAALAIAEKNARKYNANNITFHQGDWCNALTDSNYDIIVSNPPYIADNDIHLKQLKFEPEIALTAGTDGLNDTRIIISQARNYLKNNGALVLEHGFNQEKSLIELLLAENFSQCTDHCDLAQVARFATAKVTYA